MSDYQPHRLKIALGLGDQEMEQRLRPALDAADEFVVVAQCLAADQLLQVAESHQADVMVVAWSLHRLTDALLDQLERPGLVVVLLVPDPTDERWQARRGPVLALHTDAATLHAVVFATRRGGRIVDRPRPADKPVVLKAADRPAPRVATVIAVAGGVGSPGRTTVAINLATALGAAADTVLVDADLCAPAVAAYVDRDPSRNLCTLAHCVREDPHTWSDAAEDELQTVGVRGSSTKVLCGLPKREMRTSISPAFVERLVAELSHRYRWVILDVGPELLGTDAAAASHRAALSRAHHVLLVTASDLVGLWHARTALDQLERQLGIERRAVNLIVNRHDARFHHSRAEVEWHLGASVAAVIPFDHAATQRAISQQRPLVSDPSTRAGRAILGLAERLNEVRLHVPAESTSGRVSQTWWRRVFSRTRPVATTEPRLQPERLPVVVAREGRGRAW